LISAGSVRWLDQVSRSCEFAEHLFPIPPPPRLLWQRDLFALVDRLEANPSPDGVTDHKSAWASKAGCRLAQIFAADDRRPLRLSLGCLPEPVSKVEPTDILPVVGGDDLKFTVGERWLAVFEALA